MTNPTPNAIAGFENFIMWLKNYPGDYAGAISCLIFAEAFVAFTLYCLLAK